MWTLACPVSLAPFREGVCHPRGYGQAKASQYLTFSYTQLLYPLEGRTIVDTQRMIALVALSGRDLLLSAALYGGQVHTRDDGTRFLQFCRSLAYECLLCVFLALWDLLRIRALHCPHGLTADQTRYCSTFLWGEGDMY